MVNDYESELEKVRQLLRKYAMTIAITSKLITPGGEGAKIVYATGNVRPPQVAGVSGWCGGRGGWEELVVLLSLGSHGYGCGFRSFNCIS